MAAITSPFTTTGQLALPKNAGAVSVIVELYGDYTGLQFSFQGSLDGANGWTNLAAIDLTSGAVISGTIAPSNASSNMWRVPCDGMMLRMNVTQISTNGATVTSKQSATEVLLQSVLNNPSSFAVAPVRCSSALAKTSNVTVADIPGLSVTLVAGRKYIFDAVLYVTATANGGVKVGTGGTATATSTIMFGQIWNGATVGTTAQVTALGTVVNATEVGTIVFLSGEIIVNAGGTFTLQGAQNSSHSDTTTYKIGSFLRVSDVA